MPEILRRQVIFSEALDAIARRHVAAAQALKRDSPGRRRCSNRERSCSDWVRGPGRVEAYLQGKLFMVFILKRNQGFAPEP